MKDLEKTAWAGLIETEGNKQAEAIAELLGRMTLNEKLRQMSGSNNIFKLMAMTLRYNLFTSNSGLNRRLGIPDIRFTDGPRGIARGKSTCFPVAIARGASWDTDLEERIGSAMGVEALAQGANFLGSVCVNLLRHPGWGRAQETYSEDPYLLGDMGVASARGVQRHVMACAKHFACNNIEDSRFYVDIRIDERTLREIYLPHFKRCIDEGAAAVMSAYNRVNGDYCPHSVHLLRDILKGDWGFEGLVMSDFVLGTRDTRKAALGGLDIEMPFRRHFGRKLKRAVRRGDVPEDTVDEAVTRILRQKARFTARSSKQVPVEKVAGSEHAELAKEAAQKGIVLLKNENGALPLRRDLIGKIAVIGKLADTPNTGDRGSSRVHPPYTITPLQGITDRAGDGIEVIYDKGGNINRARRSASECDAAVVVAGLTWKDEGEGGFSIAAGIGGDRRSLGLDKKDEELILNVTEASDRCVVVLTAGSAVTMEAWKDAVPAIVFAWYPGMEGGNAIADVLFGDVNPSGKLPLTFPKNEAQLPPFDTKAKVVDYGYYHGYRLFDHENLEPEFPFGFGLSYTHYKYSNLRISEKEIGKNGTLTINVDVTNTGSVAGEEIVQLYIGYRGSGVDRPKRELKGFTRLRLEPGQTGTAHLVLKAEELAFFETDSNRWIVEEIEYTVYVGPSSSEDDLKLKETFAIA